MTKNRIALHRWQDPRHPSPDRPPRPSPCLHLTSLAGAVRAPRVAPREHSTRLGQGVTAYQFAITISDLRRERRTVSAAAAGQAVWDERPLKQSGLSRSRQAAR